MEISHDAARLRAHPSAVARATGAPKRTLQEWIQPYVAQRTNHGYPLSIWQQVLREHDWSEEIDLEMALRGAASRNGVLHDAEVRDDARDDVQARAGTMQHGAELITHVTIAEVVSRATAPLERLLGEERARTDQERERASTAEQAAAMWQERARNLETQVEQLLALPAHEEESGRRWWQWWRKGK